MVAESRENKEHPSGKTFSISMLLSNNISKNNHITLGKSNGTNTKKIFLKMITAAHIASAVTKGERHKKCADNEKKWHGFYDIMAANKMQNYNKRERVQSGRQHCHRWLFPFRSSAFVMVERAR